MSFAGMLLYAAAASLLVFVGWMGMRLLTAVCGKGSLKDRMRQANWPETRSWALIWSGLTAGFIFVCYLLGYTFIGDILIAILNVGNALMGVGTS